MAMSGSVRSQSGAVPSTVTSGRSPEGTAENGNHTAPFSQIAWKGASSGRPASRSGAITLCRRKSVERPVLKPTGTPRRARRTSTSMIPSGTVRVSVEATGPSTSSRSPIGEEVRMPPP